MAQKVYTFGDGKAEGNAGMRNLLGGKGDQSAEMNLLRMPVPARIHNHNRSMHRITIPIWP